MPEFASPLPLLPKSFTAEEQSPSGALHSELAHPPGVALS